MAGRVRTLAHEGQVPSNGSYRSWLAAAVAPLVAASACGQVSGPARAGDATPVRERTVTLAFLLQEAGGEKPGAETRAARDLAVRVHAAEVVRVVDDGVLHLAKVGSYRPNAWGVHDTHGNVAEWTRSAYRPYPYDGGAARQVRTAAVPAGAADAPAGDAMRVVRGGSWGDRPKLARSSYRWRYPAWQRVFDVGFRIVIEGD